MSKRSILVCAALMVLLLALALPFIQKLRVSSSRSYCQEHQRRLWQAMSFTCIKSVDAVGKVVQRPGLPAASVLSPRPVEDRQSWVVGLLPHLGSQQFFAGFETEFDAARAWHDPMIKPIGQNRLSVVLCPAKPQLQPIADLAPTQMVALGGLAPDGANLPPSSPRAGAFRYDSITTLDSFQDSLSSTAILTETTYNLGGWIRAGQPTLRMLNTEQLPYLGVGGQFGGLHPSGTNVFYADGSSRFVTDRITPTVFQAMLTIAGGPQELGVGSD